MRRAARKKFSSTVGETAFFVALTIALLHATSTATETRPGPAALDVSVVSALAQVFPDGKISGGKISGTARAQVEAARGEWEPFQIVVRAGATALDGVRAEASELAGPDGAKLSAPRLYRVGYLDVRTPSSREGHAGAWPDALIPDVDAFVGEKRAAFPFRVPPNEARAIWVEIFVPEKTSPGRYAGAITVAANGLSAKIPVELLVHRFALPKTSSLPITFGFAKNALPAAHGPLDPAALDALARRYGVAALRHRISLHGGSFDPPPARADGSIDFAPYDAEVGPFLDGTADRGGPADGARASAIDLRVPARTRDDGYARAMVAHLRARGWLARAFAYVADEPADDKLAEVRTRAAWLARVAPEIPRLVTHARAAALDGPVDLYCPVVNFVDDKPGNSKNPPRDAYAKLWWYQSCMSHGCDEIGGDYFSGWPNLTVDAPAVAHRILEWLTFRYHVGGELYYNTVEGYAPGRDPWRDQLLHGGNGDGTLFYPGRPDQIGGRTQIPVESIRLALIREGLEDYEYLALYAEKFGREAADAVAASIAPRTWDWQHDPERLYAARHQLAADLDRALH